MPVVKYLRFVIAVVGKSVNIQSFLLKPVT